MGPFKKKVDPISARGRELNSKIAALESKIKELNEQARRSETPDARFRSTAYPQGQTPPAPPPPDPVFEKVDRKPLASGPGAEGEERRYNELGLRKYDLYSIWERLRQQWRGPAAPNPKLVNYLAAGSIQGLRPLRYEKRVARRRFIALAIVLSIVLLGIFLSLAKRR
ncbi:MAG TPA: hypothetical protein VHB20_15375 [Verrucomicrobiae bacterium]|jgi:hypothetical protein|nr:hypothetical protein [Verrucomicrobiae bacterium]